MFPIHIIPLALVLFGSLVTNAIPIPAVLPDHVKPGSVLRAMPMHFEPFHTKNSGHTGTIRHPVIALSHPDAHGKVPVVVVSHNHLDHMAQVPPHDAHHYDVHSKAGGYGEFEPGSQISVGHPVHVHVDDLHHVTPGPDPHKPEKSFMPAILHPQDTHELKHAVHVASGQEFNHPPHPASPPPWRHT